MWRTRLSAGLLSEHNMPAPQFPTGQVTPAQANGLVNVMNNITNDMISPAAGIEMTKTDRATVQGKSAMYVDSNGTGALTSNQVIYRGFMITGSIGATSFSQTVTLPNGGFDNANYDVFLNYIGEKATAPTSRTDVNVFANGVAMGNAGAQSTTQFTASGFRTPGGNFQYVVYSYVAIGTKA